MSSQVKKIIIAGNTGVGNVGDEAIASGMIKLVKSAFPAAKITLLSSNPAETTKIQQIHSVQMWPAGFRSIFSFIFGWKFFPTFAAHYNSDLFILGGGGLFSDEKPAAILIWSVQWFWAKVFSKKVIFIGQSVGPLKASWAKAIVKFVYNHVDLAVVRDNDSALLLRSIGVKNVEVSCDAALALAYEVANFQSINKYLILSLRPWEYRENFLTEIALFVDEILEKTDWQIYFLPFQQLQENDLLIAEKLKKMISDPSRLKIKPLGNWQEYLQLIGSAQMIIGMRLHSLILATICRRPFLALSYSSKVRSWTKEIELEEYCLDLKEITAEKLSLKFDDILENEKQITLLLERKRLQMAYRFFENEQKIQALFKN